MLSEHLRFNAHDSSSQGRASLVVFISKRPWYQTAALTKKPRERQSSAANTTTSTSPTTSTHLKTVRPRREKEHCVLAYCAFSEDANYSSETPSTRRTRCREAATAPMTQPARTAAPSAAQFVAGASVGLGARSSSLSWPEVIAVEPNDSMDDDRLSRSSACRNSFDTIDFSLRNWRP
jgi:hypothetical protein